MFLRASAAASADPSWTIPMNVLSLCQYVRIGKIEKEDIVRAILQYSNR